MIGTESYVASVGLENSTSVVTDHTAKTATVGSAIVSRAAKNFQLDAILGLRTANLA